MKVKELIQALQETPEDLEVVFLFYTDQENLISESILNVDVDELTWSDEHQTYVSTDEPGLNPTYKTFVTLSFLD